MNSVSYMVGDEKKTKLDYTALQREHSRLTLMPAQSTIKVPSPRSRSKLSTLERLSREDRYKRRP